MIYALSESYVCGINHYIESVKYFIKQRRNIERFIIHSISVTRVSMSTTQCAIMVENS